MRIVANKLKYDIENTVCYMGMVYTLFLSVVPPFTGLGWPFKKSVTVAYSNGVFDAESTTFPVMVFVPLGWAYTGKRLINIIAVKKNFFTKIYLGRKGISQILSNSDFL